MLKRKLALLLMILIVTMYVPSIVLAESFTDISDELVSLDDSQQLPDFIVENDLYSRESYTIDTEFDGSSYVTGSTSDYYVTDRPVSVTIKSTHFDSPWATAYQYCMSPQTEWMSCKIGGVTMVF